MIKTVDDLHKFRRSLFEYHEFSEKDQDEDMDKLLRAREGDQEAFLALLHEYSDTISFIYKNPGRPPVIPKGKKIILNYNEETREDLFSIIITNFCELIHEYDPAIGPFFAIARTKLHLRVFHEFFEPVVDNTFNTRALNDVDENKLFTELQSIFLDEERNEYYKPLIEAIDQLTKRQREIIQILFLNDVPAATEQDVADILGVSRPSVTMTKKTAINNLRNILAEGGFFQ